MKITSIVFSRNDGFKDDKRCIAHFLACLETFDEIIYVDWNSDEEKGSLLWKLEDRLPKTGKIKHIVIPPSVVSQLVTNPDAFAVNETLTRNIGIRRAEGDWIVNTNIDIIPPSRADLESFISKSNKDTFYTISRREAPLEIFDKYKAEEWRKFYKELCDKIPERRFPAKVSPNDSYSLINCCGDFQLAHRDIWNSIRGYEEGMNKFCFIDTNVQKKAILNGFALEAAYNPPLFHIEHGAYKITADGEKEKADKWNEGAKVNKYNNVYKWVEDFRTSENQEDWGLSNTDIEYEIF
jgi:hypothetical protein|tara:strand:+ start:662 stop:1546 length:885 start_codon:yes stop_codon:yes gene_type:complete